MYMHMLICLVMSELQMQSQNPSLVTWRMQLHLELDVT
jgi:hypothetical protein